MAHNLRKYVTQIPGARTFYRSTRERCLRGMKPLLNLMLKFYGMTYNQWDVISNKNCAFLNAPEFIKAFEAARRQQEEYVLGGWVVHINQWAADHARQLDGDFVECGVEKARMAMSNVVYIDFKTLKNRRYYLLDTFCGLDKEFSTPEEMASYHDSYQDSYQFVVDSFKDFPNVVVVKGSVPKTLSQVDIQKVAYLSIDMNCVLPEVEALKHFWPKMVFSGIVILDDYAQIGHEKQKAAMDQWAGSVGKKVLSLPTGQGMLVKS